MDIKRCLGAACAMLLTGCASGPDFRPPQPDTPAQWNALDDAQPRAGSARDGHAPPSRLVREPFDGRQWWSVFHDPVLDGLIGDAEQQNLTLRIAANRIRQARIQRAAAASGLLPSVSANAAGARTKFSENGASAALGGGGRSGEGGAASAPANTFQAGFDALWELDLWGKTRRAVEAADASTAAAVESRHEALVSLTAEIARTWFALLGARAQLRVAQDNLATQRRILSLVQSQRQAGLVAETDVLQAQTAIDATEASLPPLEQETERDANALALLLAQPPGALRERLAGRDALPDLPPRVPVGLPGDLLRRRPDIRRSESQLHAATARIGVAVAQLFPSVRLGAVGGLQASRLADLTDWASRFLLFGTAISIPVFEGGQLKANIRISEAQAREALLQYRETVLEAYHDADNAMTAYASAQRRMAALSREADAARRGLDLATSRYQSGLAAFLEVLDAQRSLHQAQLQLAQSSVQATTNLVALYKALGGGWEGGPEAD